jgi:hypothetical protein
VGQERLENNTNKGTDARGIAQSATSQQDRRTERIQSQATKQKTHP